MLYILEKFLISNNYSYLRMDGTTSIGVRQRLIKDFNEVEREGKTQFSPSFHATEFFHFHFLTDHESGRARSEPDRRR